MYFTQFHIERCLIAMHDKIKIFSGNSNPDLAQRICDSLGVPLGTARVRRFSDGEVLVEIGENVRGRDVYVVQSTCAPTNDNLMELLVITDALKRASAATITAVIPYYGYARQDRKAAPRTPITAKLVADLITTAGVNRVVTIDLHAGQIQGFFNIPLDELTAVYLLAQHFRQKALPNPVVVSTDIGNAKRARNFAELLGVPLAIIEKRRLGGNDGHSQALNLIGSVRDAQAILVDDEVDTAGTMVQAAAQVMEQGANAVYACCVHPILSGPALERLQASPIRELVCTDSVPIPPEKADPKISVLSIAPLLGEAILRVHRGGSVGEMFDHERQQAQLELAVLRGAGTVF